MKVKITLSAVVDWAGDDWEEWLEKCGGDPNDAARTYAEETGLHDLVAWMDESGALTITAHTQEETVE